MGPLFYLKRRIFEKVKIMADIDTDTEIESNPGEKPVPQYVSAPEPAKEPVKEPAVP